MFHLAQLMALLIHLRRAAFCRGEEDEVDTLCHVRSSVFASPAHKAGITPKPFVGSMLHPASQTGSANTEKLFVGVPCSGLGFIFGQTDRSATRTDPRFFKRPAQCINLNTAIVNNFPSPLQHAIDCLSGFAYE